MEILPEKGCLEIEYLKLWWFVMIFPMKSAIWSVFHCPSSDTPMFIQLFESGTEIPGFNRY